MKTNYYYIDESGNILNNEKLFIHGCIKTDTPNILKNVMQEVRDEINDELIFSSFKENFEATGFHAVDNHFDIRTALYKRLIKLNWRAYFVVVNKESDYFKSIIEKDEHEIFMISLSKLIYNRIKKSKNEKNILVFENIQLKTKSLSSILDTFFEQMRNNKYDCEFFIAKKNDDINLGIIDYLNYIIYRILSTNNKDLRMQELFELFAPKIAMIHIQHTKVYLSRANEDITIENLIKNW